MIAQRRWVLALAALGASVAAGAQSRDPLVLSALVEYGDPSLVSEGSAFRAAGGGALELAYYPLSFFNLFARGSAQAIAVAGLDAAWLGSGSAGVGLRLGLTPRLSLGADAWAGLGRLYYGGSDAGVYELGVRAGTFIRLSAALNLGLTAGWRRLAEPSQSLADIPGAGLSLSVRLGQLSARRERVTVETVEAETVFPVFRSLYESEDLGSVTIRNGETGPITDIEVSLWAPDYMGKPQACGQAVSLAPGQSLTLPLHAIFDERVLELTENSKGPAEIQVRYRLFGTQRTASADFTLRLHHRNAMSWEDDRMAAAFVSSTDPGLLFFRDGKAWVPLEITMVREGFIKAWRVGAKEWMDNVKAGTAAFYPMTENWKRYAPSGLQAAEARFDLTNEAQAIEAFDQAVDRFVLREMETVIGDYERRLSARRDPETLNEYGIALAEAGLLDRA